MRTPLFHTDLYELASVVFIFIEDLNVIFWTVKKSTTCYKCLLHVWRMTFNLQCGNDIIAFHFDVRFCFGNDRNVIVRNTKQSSWGHEERSLPGGYFPFQQDMYFELIILTEPHCFKVDHVWRQLWCTRLFSLHYLSF